MAVYYTGGQMVSSEGASNPLEIWKVDLYSQETSRLYANRAVRFEVRDLTLSPDREYLAFQSGVIAAPAAYRFLHSYLRVMRTDGSELRTLAETSEYEDFLEAPQWSPDGARLAYVRYTQAEPSRSLHLFDLQSARDQVLGQVGAGEFAWAPDGTQIVMVAPSEPWGLALLDLGTRQQRLLWKGDKGIDFLDLAWQPKGAQIVVTAKPRGGVKTDRDGLYLVDASTGQQRKVADAACCAHWAPDGKKLVYHRSSSDQGSQLWLFDLATETSTILLDQTVAAALSASPWSRNGEALLLSVEEAPNSSYWISVLMLADRNLIKLVQTKWFSSPVW